MTQFAEYSTFCVHIDNTCDNGLNMDFRVQPYRMYFSIGNPPTP